MASVGDPQLRRCNGPLDPKRIGCMTGTWIDSKPLFAPNVAKFLQFCNFGCHTLSSRSMRNSGLRSRILYSTPRNSTFKSRSRLLEIIVPGHYHWIILPHVTLLCQKTTLISYGEGIWRCHVFQLETLISKSLPGDHCSLND